MEYDNSAKGDFIDGIIDDFRIYNRSLINTEINQLYDLSNLTNYPSNGLKAY